MKSCSIKGLGYALVKRRVTNENLSTFVDTDGKQIPSRTGIRVRYISGEENTGDLGAHVARIAIDKSGIGPKEIDLITAMAFTPDQTTPSTACLAQEKLGLSKQHMMAFDLNATYSDFLYALQSAHVILAAGQVTYTLIIGAEIVSKQLGWNDRSTCIIFADGAGAAIAKQEDTNRRTPHFTGDMGDAVGVTHSDAPKPRPLFSGQPYQLSMVCMEGNATFHFAVKAMQETIEDILEQARERIKNIDQTVPRQANIRIIDNVCKHIHIDEEHVYINIEEYEDTLAANVPLVLGEMSEEDLLQPDMKIILSGPGTSSIWAGCYIGL